MGCFTKNSCDLFFIIASFATEWSLLFVKYMIPMNSADASGLVVEGDIVVVGILPETQILLKIIFPLLVT